MTAEEIALMAQHNEPMPESFSLAEQLLYKSIRLTYESFRRGLIDRKQGAKEKQAGCYKQVQSGQHGYAVQSKASLCERRQQRCRQV